MKKSIGNIVGLAILWFTFSGSLSAQNATIKGVVRVGSLTNIPTGITITIQGTSTAVMPDIYGRYTLTSQSGVPITLVASLTGYYNLIKNITPVVSYIPNLSNYVDFWFDPPQSTISDYDGNLYKTVTIGSQIWMAENLRATHFQDGTSIRYVSDDNWSSEWTNPRTKYCYYNNNGDSYRFDYGGLYNFYSVYDKNLCPVGWHVSTNTDWTTLITYYGGDGIAGANLKEVGTTHWNSPNSGALNSDGFTGLPGGSRDPYDSGFEGLGTVGLWWSNDLLIPYFRALLYNSPEIVVNNTARTHGLSVRCVKNILPDLLTSQVSSVTSVSAQSGGQITYDGGSSIIRRGLCWSTSPGPTITNDTTWDRGSSSIFTNNMNNLIPNQAYYVRAYAINSEGPAYGNEISFNTLPEPPIATTGAVTDVSYTTATLHGIVNANGGVAVVTFQYGLTPLSMESSSFPAIPGSVTGTASIPVSANLVNLDPGSTYHYRIRAESTGGITYSDILTFYTCPSISISSVITNVSCYGENNGSVNISVIGGASPYTYTWTGPNGYSSVIEDPGSLMSGTYTLIVRDANLCEQSSSIAVNQPDALDLTLTPTNALCYNGIGSISANITGNPLVDLQINIDGGGFVPVSASPVVFSNLTAGSHNVILRRISDNSCLVSKDVEVTQPVALSATVSGSTSVCQNTPHPLIIFTAENGTAPYIFTYTLNEGGSQTITTVAGNSVSLEVPTNTSGIFYYSLENVRDASPSACIQYLSDENATVTVFSSPVASASVADVKCTGCTDGSIDLTITDGTPDFLYEWTGPNGYTSDVEDPISLRYGIYHVNVTDDNECTVSIDAEVMNPLQVTTALDNELFGSLRYAINYANSRQGPDEIVFNIPGEGPHTIALLNPLPAVDDPVIIDGYTQEGSSMAFETEGGEGVGVHPANLMIELLGGSSVPTGLAILGGNCTVRGLMINGFGEVGIYIIGLKGGNTIEGNHFGLDADYYEKSYLTIGIKIDNSSGNIIGGDNPENRNVIIGRGEEGNCLIYIDLPESSNNVVKGNYLGVDPIGQSELGQVPVGIRINAGAHDNTIGPGNVISGSSLAGIQMEPSTDPYYPNNNIIIGNYIGTNRDGTIDLPNGNGIRIFNGPQNTIGGDTPVERNIISGNTGNGIEIIFDTYIASSSNTITGNYIGLNASGNVAIGNGTNGIAIQSRDNIIGGLEVTAGNVISGNGHGGIYISGELNINNQIIGNLIGTDNTGNSLVSNRDDGINIYNSSKNRISGNVLCGAGTGIGDVPNNGIEILGNLASENVITGNFIGTNALSTEGLGNGFLGIQVSDGAHDNIIGGLALGERNIISGNINGGIWIMNQENQNYKASNNKILGNYIGTNVDGTSGLGNEKVGIQIDTDNNEIKGNLVSGNGGSERNPGLLFYKGATGNRITSNYFGTNATATSPIPNSGSGININGSPGNTIGGLTSEERNIIFDGIEITGSNSTGNKISGNYLGLNLAGSSALGNGGGIGIYNGPSQNEIGPLNVISGISIGNAVKIQDLNSFSNKVFGNYIGCSADGSSAISNGSTGIVIEDSPSNIIGGSEPKDKNIISGSSNDFGIHIRGQNAKGNQVTGNFIGTDPNGSQDFGNASDGIVIDQKASENIIGPFNLISGNGGNGVSISGGTNGNTIMGNKIGTDMTGIEPLGNSSSGVYLGEQANNNVIGGDETADGNIIAFNGNSGVVCASLANPGTGNSILSNLIYSNTGLGIDLGGDGMTPNDPGDVDGDIDPGANNLQNYPEIESVSFSPGFVTIKGSLDSPETTNNDYTLQFFANNIKDDSGYGEGQYYLGSGSFNSADKFTFTFPIKGIYGQVISATATDVNGNTSEFSEITGGLADQVVGFAWPVKFVYNPIGAEKITDGTDIKAITNSFDAWSNISTAKSKFVVSEGPADLTNAVAGDGINLVSFVDTEYDWPEGVLAYASKTTEMDDGGVNGKITDADIIVNPAFKDVLIGTTGLAGEVGTPGFYDIQSIITHEIGHTLGLLHSGLTRSTMFFWMNKQSIGKRTLESDDIAWVGYKYPESTFASTYGTITGNITYGYGLNPDNLDPVAGALVTAINKDNSISFHAYSDADGNYVIPVLSGSNQYYIHIQPLDGDVGGYPMTPANISSYIYSNTVFTDYPEEYFNINDNDGGTDPNNLADDETKQDPVSVLGVANIITNRDITPPKVVSITPDNESLVKVLPDIIITFSEPVDLTSFSNASCYLEGTIDGEVDQFYGSASQWDDNTLSVIFTPDMALPTSTTFNLILFGIVGSEKGIIDLKGNPLSSNYQPYSITTIAKDQTAPTVTSPTQLVVSDVFVTDTLIVSFSEPMNKASVESNYTFTRGSTNVGCSLIWSDNGSTVAFDPVAALSEEATYELTLKDKITDLNGVRIGFDDNDNDDNITFQFNTVKVASPYTSYIGPENLQTDVQINTPVVVDFTEPIDISTINWDGTSPSFTLREYLGTSADGALLGSDPIPGDFEFLNNNSRVVFRPSQNLKFSPSVNLPQKYLITLTTGIKDVSQPEALSLEIEEYAIFSTAIQPSAPSITYIEKPTGIIGDEVIISGKGFDPDPTKNMVSFAGTIAPVETATLTSLNVAVPTGAVSGEVTVTVNKSKSEGFNYVIFKASDLPTDYGTSSTSIGNGTHSMDLDGDCTTAFITNSGSNTVSVVDIDDDGVLTYRYDIPVGQIPMDIALNSTDTRAYVTNYGSHTVSVIDLTTATNDANPDEVDVKEINVGINPYGVAVVPDGDFVYVANYTSQNLSVIDVNPNSGGFDHATSSIDLKTGAKGTAITGDCGLVLVATDNGLQIVNINPQSEEFDCFNCIVETGSSGTRITKVDVTGDAGYAIATTEDGRILLIDVLPGSDYFGTAVSSTGSNTTITSAKNAGDGLHVYATTENHEVLIFEISEGGVSIPDIEGSFTGIKNLKLVDRIPDVGNDAVAVDALNQRLLTADSQLNPDGSSSGKAWSSALYVPPQKLVYRIDGLILNVTELMYGSLKRALANELISFLNSAIKYIEANKYKEAINRLNTFIVKLKDLIKSRSFLYPDEYDKAQDMINIAYEIIAQLKGIKSGDEELIITDADSQSNKDLITMTKLGLIYPNPTRDGITIDYEIADDQKAGKVSIKVYDVLGRVIGNLVNETLEPGRYSTSWNGRHENGTPVSRGIYYIRFSAGKTNEVKKIMLVR